MSVGILLVTHENIGAQLAAVAETIFNRSIPGLRQISVPADLTPDALGEYADLVRDGMLETDQGQGVLVLTDLFGATPDNLVRYFSKECNARVVSGVNLPMLLRVLNYAHNSLEQLCETALEGDGHGAQQGRE